ncbi:MAG: hypothetical protein CL910_07285 [Deltaproteobacteria bacterium]|nr:hypothetical protein [Deltaproteobacteria bacterium]
MQRTEEDATQARAVLESTSSSRWQELSQSTVVFGHQSIGSNIIEGLETLAHRYPGFDLPIVALSVADAVSGELPAGPGLFHFAAGRNRDPEAKIESFRQVMASELGQRARIALLKFCYADFGYEIDPDRVFEAYSRAAEELRSSNPSTRLLHVTAPLTVPWRRTALDRGKDLVKTLVRRPVYADPNVARSRYGARVVDRYSPWVFDIARVESTGRDGSRGLQKIGEEDAYFLRREWTEDGEHLSAPGRERVAEELLRMLLVALD